MHKIKDIIFLNDIVRLPKYTLKEICTDLKLETDGTSFDLSNRIFEQGTKDKDILEMYQNRLLAGRACITWYQLEDKNSLAGLKNILEEDLSYNPFNNILNINEDEISSRPIIMAAAEGKCDKETYLRYIYSTGNRKDIIGTNVRLIPKTEITTVYFQEGQGIIEIRANDKYSNKIASDIAGMVGQQAFLQQKEVLAPFGNDVENIANKLNGELIDSTSVPELLIEDFTDEQANAVINILDALNNFFDDEDPTPLIDCLKHSAQIFGDYLLTVPFTALILNGMERVGLRSTVGDLRTHPLYNALRPYLQHQGGFIKFNYPVNGVQKPFTIRVGLNTNSIFFVTPATEEVIQFVRNNIII